MLQGLEVALLAKARAQVDQGKLPRIPGSTTTVARQVISRRTAGSASVRSKPPLASPKASGLKDKALAGEVDKAM